MDSQTLQDPSVMDWEPCRPSLAIEYRGKTRLTGQGGEPFVC